MIYKIMTPIPAAPAAALIDFTKSSSIHAHGSGLMAARRGFASEAIVKIRAARLGEEGSIESDLSNARRSHFLAKR